MTSEESQQLNMRVRRVASLPCFPTHSPLPSSTTSSTTVSPPQTPEPERYFVELQAEMQKEFTKQETARKDREDEWVCLEISLNFLGKLLTLVRTKMMENLPMESAMMELEMTNKEMNYLREQLVYTRSELGSTKSKLRTARLGRRWNLNSKNKIELYRSAFAHIFCCNCAATAFIHAAPHKNTSLRLCRERKIEERCFLIQIQLFSLYYSIPISHVN